MLNFHQRAMHERKFFMKLNSLPFSPKVSEALRCSSNCEGFTPWGKKLFWKWCWYCSNAVRFSALHFRLAAMLLSPQAYGGDWLPPPLLMGLAKSLEYSSANLPDRPDWKNLHRLSERLAQYWRFSWNPFEDHNTICIGGLRAALIWSSIVLRDASLLECRCKIFWAADTPNILSRGVYRTFQTLESLTFESGLIKP